MLLFRVGAWHVYGHKGKCRWVLNIRGTKGAGLFDAENLERLWPELIRFAGHASRMRYAICMDYYAHYIFNINFRSVLRYHSSVLVGPSQSFSVLLIPPLSSSDLTSPHQSSPVLISPRQSSSVLVSPRQPSSVLISPHQFSSVRISQHRP
jgi:hypothetical protein